MFNFTLRQVDFWNEIDAVWAIFKDSLQMFSDLSKSCAGHTTLNNKYKLYDLFYWTLKIPKTTDYIGVYNSKNTLIGLSYLTHISPVFPIPPESEFQTLREWEESLQWEASYHGSLHPLYRSPKHSSKMVRATIEYFIEKHDLSFLFSWLRVDNRGANLLLRRNGFEHIDILKNYRVHGGVNVDYNLYVYRGNHGRFR